MYPNAPAHTGGLELSTADVAPEGRMGEAGVPFRLRVADPFLLYRLLQQRCLLFLLFWRIHVGYDSGATKTRF